MAIKDLKVGTPMADGSFDYTHLLPEERRQEGYRLNLTKDREHPQKLPKVVLNFKGEEVGGIGLDKSPAPNVMKITRALLFQDHRGKGVGLPMYEALYTHAYHKMGIKFIAGDMHSSSANKVHNRLSTKHGMKYLGAPNYPSGFYETPDEWHAAEDAAFDFKYRPYKYKIE
jgi:hypothetical protein